MNSGQFLYLIPEFDIFLNRLWANSCVCGYCFGWLCNYRELCWRLSPKLGDATRTSASTAKHPNGTAYAPHALHPRQKLPRKLLRSSGAHLDVISYTSNLRQHEGTPLSCWNTDHTAQSVTVVHRQAEILGHWSLDEDLGPRYPWSINRPTIIRRLRANPPVKL